MISSWSLPRVCCPLELDIGLSTRQGCSQLSLSRSPRCLSLSSLLLQVESGLLPVGALAAVSQLLCKSWDAGSRPCQAGLRGLCQEPSLPQPSPGEIVRNKSFRHTGREVKELLAGGPWRSLGRSLPASSHQAGSPEGIPGCLSPQITVCFCYLLAKYRRANVPPVTVVGVPSSSLKR